MRMLCAAVAAVVLGACFTAWSTAGTLSLAREMERIIETVETADRSQTGTAEDILGAAALLRETWERARVRLALTVSRVECDAVAEALALFETATVSGDTSDVGAALTLLRERVCAIIETERVSIEAIL